MKTHRILAVTALLAALAGCRAADDTVEVYRSDGARQCEGNGISLEAMQPMLGDIPVYAARKDHVYAETYPEVCGAPMSSVNVYTINRAHWPQAQARGFLHFPPAD
ncbi:MAG: hypothetical protein Q4A62_09730 [Eikenella sp.]|nr:hypothetical protein [Eikenella sp.]